jgi:DNA-binding NarL/FixJ family response regulator
MSSQQSSASVIIADDHPLVLEGLSRLLATAPDLHLAGRYTDGISALEAIRRMTPDLAVLDLAMPQLSGLQVLEAIHQSGLSTRVVLFGATLQDSEIHAAIMHGAQGVLFKDSAPATLLSCLRTVQRGDRWISEAIQAAITREDEHLRVLKRIRAVCTPREREIIVLAGRGVSNSSIAAELGLSIATVRVHFHNIYSKLSVFSRSDITAIARLYGDSLM